ncbi:hypothetical protein K474DRAFT_1663798 [Panus rudis PR-1116 ss-1]|nr:hypothetical protein K474DRAFT_1663798 [Panus rudis PR-1116 ss-1]
MSSPSDHPRKQPIVRGARACKVCRQAKMKCVGTEDGDKCQRCKRAGTECVFEKHRRGRKPGSKLSEASKMLRRLEKGLNNAKQKTHSHEPALTVPYASGSQVLFPPADLATVTLSSGFPTPPALTVSAEDEESDKSCEGMHPVNLIRKESERNSFFKTILNPEDADPLRSATSSQKSPSPTRSPTASPASVPFDLGGLQDPITAGLITDRDARIFFDYFFIRLNSFINLFDPALHSVDYVRTVSPGGQFLFTTIIMACCKFFRPNLYQDVRRLANEFAARAFLENCKSVEVVQAFACLTYWKEPNDDRTWMYIGWACRMALELGLNRYVAHPPAGETERQFLLRRNRERTYLVLFVHDRSLSTQTGRPWMLSECDLVRHSHNWHKQGVSTIQPVDVIVAAFVQLRLIASQASDVFHNLHKTDAESYQFDLEHHARLQKCNVDLEQWMAHWQHEMSKAELAENFHHAFIRFFWLYCRVFLNSFGLRQAIFTSKQVPFDQKILDICYSSALEHLQSVTENFAQMNMLRYGQETITVMSAYCAVYLMRLLRSANTRSNLPASAKDEIYSVIARVADAYSEISEPSSSTASHHASFLRSLVYVDYHRAEQMDHERERSSAIATDRAVSGTFSSPGSQQTDGMSIVAPYPTSSSPSAIQPPSHFHHNNPISPSAPSVLSTMSTQNPGQDVTRPSSDYGSSPTNTSAMRYGQYPVNGADTGAVHIGPQPSSSASPSASTSSYPQPAIPQSQPQAQYFNIMFKELGLHNGFNSIYEHGSSVQNGYNGANAGGLGVPSPGPHQLSYANGQMNGHPGQSYASPSPYQQAYPSMQMYNAQVAYGGLAQ